MSTWACPFTAFQQPVVIPVGKSALGRIFNVVGSTIDAFFEPFLSSKFSLNSYSQYQQSNILSSQFLLVVGFIHYSSAAHPVYLELPQGALLSIDFAYYSLLQHIQTTQIHTARQVGIFTSAYYSEEHLRLSSSAYSSDPNNYYITQHFSHTL